MTPTNFIIIFIIFWFGLGYLSWLMLRNHLTESESRVKPLIQILMVTSGLFSLISACLVRLYMYVKK